MKHWKKVLTVMILVAGLSATETRVATMGGDIDFLLNDEQNVLLYPSTVMDFGSLVTLEFGTLPSWGLGTYPAGLLITGNDRMAIALIGNRPIYQTNHPTNPLTVNAYSLNFGMGMGNLNLGLQIAMGIRQQSNTPAANTTYSYNAMFLGIGPGASFRTENMGIDASFGFVMESWKDEGYTLTTDTLKFAGSPTIRANMRLFMGTRRKKIIGAFRAAFFKDAYEQNGTTYNNGSTVNIDLKIGQCMRPMRGVKMIGGMNINFTSVSTSDTSGNTAINSGFVLGGETQISRRIGFRAGVTRNIFSYNKTKNGAVSNSAMGFASAPLNVNIGAFLNLGGVRIDASIAQDLLFNGPYFLTGTPSRLAGTISAIAKF